MATPTPRVMMLHEFLDRNRDALIARCREKVAKRPARRPTAQELRYGIPLFLDQLIEALRVQARSGPSEASKMSFALSGTHPTPSPTNIGRTAARHGNELLRTGFTLDQVVHDYGDLCQAATEMAVEQGATVAADEFRMLNGYLDEAIADAITEFGRQRDQSTVDEMTRTANERLGYLAHELRNLIGNAMLAVAAIRKGTVGVSGATGALLDRSLIGLRDLVDRTLVEVRLTGGIAERRERIHVAELIGDVQVATVLEAAARNLEFIVAPIDADLVIEGDRLILGSAVANLLQNAVKFTRPHGRISLTVRPADRILIDVEDECGGIPEGNEEQMFRPFEQLGSAGAGLGLGLPASRRGVEANGGKLYVRSLPGVGCVFTVDLPRPASPLP
jgi:signal transduction histidine kinase